MTRLGLVLVLLLLPLGCRTSVNRRAVCLEGVERETACVGELFGPNALGQYGSTRRGWSTSA